MEITKGKWTVSSLMTYRNQGEGVQAYFILGEIRGKTGRTIAEVGCWKDREHTLEDAHLMAASPKLLEAARIALDLVKVVLYEHPDDAIAQAQKKVIEDALASVEGREVETPNGNQNS